MLSEVKAVSSCTSFIMAGCRCLLTSAICLFAAQADIAQAAAIFGGLEISLSSMEKNKRRRRREGK